jgi:hypothetical protein
MGRTEAVRGTDCALAASIVAVRAGERRGLDQTPGVPDVVAASSVAALTLRLFAKFTCGAL